MQPFDQSGTRDNDGLSIAQSRTIRNYRTNTIGANEQENPANQISLTNHMRALSVTGDAATGFKRGVQTAVKVHKTGCFLDIFRNRRMGIDRVGSWTRRTVQRPARV